MQWPDTIRAGETQQLEPLVRRVLAPNPSPYTFTGTQTWLVGAGAEIAVIDPGPDGGFQPGHADINGANENGESHVDAIMRAVGDAKVTAILCTHTHRDHSPASRPLQAATGAPIIGCAPLVLDDTGPRADSAFDADYRPCRVLMDGETIHGEGWSLQAVATPGHTSNHVCFALLESGALFTGDHVMKWSTTVVSPPDGDMAEYMASLSKLYDREDRIYYPAHGPAVGKPRQLVRGMIGHRRQRERQILKLLEIAPHTIPAMVAVMYKALDPRLVDLQKKGRVNNAEEIWCIL